MRIEEEATYNPKAVEEKWQRLWQEKKVFSPNLDRAKNPFYNLMMFPYPSAEGLHVGNMYAFTGADVYGRFKRMQGYDIFEPIGLDGFGIHSENYALKVGRHPMEQARISESNFYRQLRSTGNGYDWTRTVQTYEPGYYKWTQWIFVQMFKKGLAYRKKAKVNWCPSCKTVLADEQVVNGVCERCSSLVQKKELEQWFFKITAYADRLLENLDKLNWTEKVKIAQRQWIGRSEGAIITFPILGGGPEIEVYTVFPETIYGVTYMVLAPEHPMVERVSMQEYKNKVRRYVEQAKAKTEQERIAEGKEKTGVFTGSYCINPVNGVKVPIWVADYVLAEYGTGAVMGVPGSDHRDFAFAKKYNLPVIRVIAKVKGDSSKVKSDEDVLEEGYVVNSEQFSGLATPHPAKEKIKDYLEEKDWGRRVIQYHLRDWLISRQRYWGPPIPMIYCKACGKEGKSGWFPVSEDQLPVELPHIEDHKPLGTGTSPLATHEEFYQVPCPECKAPARRETDVSDTFLDSSWYFLRYLATDLDNMPFASRVFARKMARSMLESRLRWLPVHMYIGGAEHSVLHLLYARFVAMALKDMGYLSFEEPFTRFYAHGLLIRERAKMSKSRGNVIIPDEYIQKYGADTLRLYLMFLGPFDQGGEFYDTGIEGMHRFVKRVWKLVSSHIAGPASLFPPASVRPSLASLPTDSALSGSLTPASPASGSPRQGQDRLRFMHKTIKKVTQDLENLRYNTAIAVLMEWYNFLSEKLTTRKSQLTSEEAEVFLKLLAPFAPHMTEELWQKISAGPASGLPRFSSIHTQTWPSYDPKYLEEEEVTIVVQVNGRVRDTIKVNPALVEQKDIEQKAKESEKMKRYLSGRRVVKVVYIEGKVINFVMK